VGPLGVQPIGGDGSAGVVNGGDQVHRPAVRAAGTSGGLDIRASKPAALAPHPWAEIWNVKVPLWLLLSRRATHYFSYHHLI
jgi:hypothetical protein